MIKIDPKKQTKFNEVSGADNRVTKGKLKEYLVKRYKEELANKLIKELATYFSDFSQ